MYEPLCCERVEVELGHYLEDTLPRNLRLRVESHLAACPDCWREVQHLRLTVTCLGEVPRRSVPAPLKNSLLHAVRSTAPSPPVHPRINLFNIEPLH